MDGAGFAAAWTSTIGTVFRCWQILAMCVLYASSVSLQNTPSNPYRTIGPRALTCCKAWWMLGRSEVRPNDNMHRCPRPNAMAPITQQPASAEVSS